MLPRLYCITDAESIEACILDRVCGAARGGVGMIQVREKRLADREVAGLARRLKDLLGDPGPLLLINDRIDIALAIGADGVHLSSETSVAPSVARKALGAESILGVSTHSLEEIDRAAEEGADFVTFGPVFDTPSKRKFGPPQGLEALAEAARRSKIPLFALGGVALERLDEIVRAGAHGAAAIRALLEPSQPERVAREWAQRWEASVGGR